MFYSTARSLSIKPRPIRLPAYQEAPQSLLSWDKRKEKLKAAKFQMPLWPERPETSVRLAHSTEGFSRQSDGCKRQQTASTVGGVKQACRGDSTASSALQREEGNDPAGSVAVIMENLYQVENKENLPVSKE